MSGFKISTESLSPEFYQVVLTLTGGTGVYPTADGNDNGAVCPQDHSQFATKPTTLALGRRVARGHQRFLAIIENLQKYADAQIQDVRFSSAYRHDGKPVQLTPNTLFKQPTTVACRQAVAKYTVTPGVTVSSPFDD